MQLLATALGWFFEKPAQDKSIPYFYMTKGTTARSGQLPFAVLFLSTCQGKQIDNRSVPVGLLLSKTIKEKVARGAYIPFSCLIEPGEQQTDAEIIINATTGATTSRARQKDIPLSFVDWTSAWNTFCAILMENGTGELARNLAKHFQVVHEIYKDGQAWEFYDRTFRTLIEFGHAAWGQEKSDTRQQAARRSNNNPNPQGSPRNAPKGQQQQGYNGGDKYPTGTCHRWHKGLGCADRATCTFTHTCLTCAKPHPTSRCNKNSFRAQHKHFAKTNKGRSFQK